MKKNIEIRWHGRGGQGAKTAALLLADVAFNTGMHVQGFPEYGPERMGAPITAYNRIGESEIRVHSNIYHPDYVVVVDETLLHSVCHKWSEGRWCHRDQHTASKRRDSSFIKWIQGKRLYD